MRNNNCICFNDEICGREFIKYGEAPSAICPALTDKTDEENPSQQHYSDNTQKYNLCFMQ